MVPCVVSAVKFGAVSLMRKDNFASNKESFEISAYHTRVFACVVVHGQRHPLVLYSTSKSKEVLNVTPLPECVFEFTPATVERTLTLRACGFTLHTCVMYRGY